MMLGEPDQFADTAALRRRDQTIARRDEPGDDEVLEGEPDALEQRDLVLGVAAAATAGEIGEIAGDPLPSPAAVDRGDDEIAGLRAGGVIVIDVHRGSADELGLDLAHVITACA